LLLDNSLSRVACFFFLLVPCSLNQRIKFDNRCILMPHAGACCLPSPWPRAAPIQGAGPAQSPTLPGEAARKHAPMACLIV